MEKKKPKIVQSWPTFPSVVLSVKASVFASRTRIPSQKPEAIFSPSLNFLLRIQLELSGNVSSPRVPTPSFHETYKSPIKRGLFPSRSFTTWLSNSSSVQSSLSSLLKSPSRTTTWPVLQTTQVLMWQHGQCLHQSTQHEFQLPVPLLLFLQ